ncbi:hypothetical protein ABZ128_09310 [Streptomyces sp. NPDC006326]|uniref:hypothetical protein n=1 Tax=Streptomyces sp. NPDC006326 TaxID=3156752 RepID=UPI0033AB3631
MDTYEEDEARGVLESSLPGGYIVSDMGMTLAEDALDRYRDAVEARVRRAVAAELESLPTTNNVADWCTNINRRQAIETARSGRN